MDISMDLSMDTSMDIHIHGNPAYNACHMSALQRWVSSKRRYNKCPHIYFSVNKRPKAFGEGCTE